MKAPDSTVLEARAVDFGYGGRRKLDSPLILQNVNVSVRESETVALLGHSGIGKTTLGRLCAGLLRPLRGEILLNGTPVTRPIRAITVQFQSYPCFPWLTVERNLLFGLEALSEVDPVRQQRAYWLLEKVGLGRTRALYPRELSGGMLQRLSLARCLALEPQVLILDEPFSAVDQTTKTDLIELIIELQALGKFSLLLILHDLGDAYCLADRVIVLSGKPATTICDIAVAGKDFSTFESGVLEAMNESRSTDSSRGALLALLECLRTRELPSHALLMKIFSSGAANSVVHRVRNEDASFIGTLLKDRDLERVRLGILLARPLSRDRQIFTQLISLWNRSLSTETRFALVECFSGETDHLESGLEQEAMTFISHYWGDYVAYVSAASAAVSAPSTAKHADNPELHPNLLGEFRRLAMAYAQKDSSQVNRILSSLSAMNVTLAPMLVSECTTEALK